MPQLYIRTVNDEPFPYLDTEAALMLRSALDHNKRQNRVSLRQLATQLGYKQSAILSHMANGRVAIPLDRAEELADALGMSKPQFLTAVIKQKYRNFLNAIHELKAMESPAGELQPDQINLNDEQRRVLREVIRDRYPEERWLTPHEVALIKFLRKAFPDLAVKGISEKDMRQIEAAIAAVH